MRLVSVFVLFAVGASGAYGQFAGQEPIRLTFTAAQESEPDWSPRADRIAFSYNDVWDDEDTEDIWVSGLSERPRLRLTQGLYRCSAPDWSPDGEQIAFSAVASSGDRPGIWVVNADGTGQRRVTEGTANQAAGIYSSDYWPAWSPDGSTIAYTRVVLSEFTDDDHAVLWLVEPDTGRRRELTKVSDGNVYGGAAWSPDGRYLAYPETDMAWSDWRIVRLEVDTGQRTVLTRDGEVRLYVGWTPVSGEISFMTISGLWLMEADGSNRRRIIDLERLYFLDYSWSPDQRRLVLVGPAVDTDYGELYVVGDTLPTAVPPASWAEVKRARAGTVEALGLFSALPAGARGRGSAAGAGPRAAPTGR